ncbi:Uncharacterised protein [Mycobacteroides abscessus subsp. abscessus]|nr:Uncharacterised protein [Mycobacteroides abscessus subsp. abscessus]
MIPLCGVKDGTLEAIQAFDLRNARNVQGTHPGDEELADVLLSPIGEHMPAIFVLVPVATSDARVEGDMPVQPVLGTYLLEVIKDLGLPGEELVPVGPRLEGKGIQVGGHITGRTGIGVVAPGPAHFAGLFENVERHSHLLQGDAGPDAREAGADDQRTDTDGLR